MKFNLKSISGKIFFLYMSLSLINIAFFSIIIYGSQIELIADNTILQYREMIDKVAEQLSLSALRGGGDGSSGAGNSFITVVNVLEKHVSSFMVINTKGDLLLNRGYTEAVSEKDLANAIRAVTGRNFGGARFFSDIDHKRMFITFYIPLLTGNSESVAVFSKNLNTINEKMKELYMQMGEVAAFLALFHIAVAVLFFRIFVRPLSLLHEQSRRLASGEYSVRSEIRSGDEIGELAEAFDIMAEAIEDKIEVLEEYNFKMEYELKLAGDVQKSIFPQFTESNRFSHYLFTRPCGRVSGDFYDTFQFDDGSRAYLITDVSGHGVPAALMTMTLKEKFETYAGINRDPAEMFSMLNEKVWSMFKGDGMLPRFFSGFYMVIDPDNVMTYCNAGHPYPLLISSSGEVRKLESEGGVVGIFSDMGVYYKTEKIKLENGDKIILITDGVIEAMNADNELYGWTRFIESIRGCGPLSINETVQRMIDGLLAFSDIEKLTDDATIIGIELL